MRNRYLVRKDTNDVFIYTEALAKRKDLAEVFAESPEAALRARPIPDLDTVTLAQLDEMSKADLLIFAEARLKRTLDATQKKEDLLLAVKEALFLGSAAAEEGASAAGAPPPAE